MFATKSHSWFTANAALPLLLPYHFFVGTPFVIHEYTTFLMPQSIAVALLAGFTDTLTSKNYLDSIIANKESIADYHLD
jgi:hypothetical protein